MSMNCVRGLTHKTHCDSYSYTNKEIYSQVPKSCVIVEITKKSFSMGNQLMIHDSIVCNIQHYIQLFMIQLFAAYNIIFNFIHYHTHCHRFHYCCHHYHGLLFH
jgi:hypothetical protein